MHINIVTERVREGVGKRDRDLAILGPGKLYLLVVWLVSSCSTIKFHN